MLGTLELHASFTWNPCLELWNLLEASLGTCLEPFNRNPYLEPLRGTRESSLGALTWNSDLEPRNLAKPSHKTSETYLEPRNFLEPLLRTLGFFGTFWNLLLGTSWNLHLEPQNLLKPLLGTLEPPGSLTWNPCLEPCNLAEPCGMTAQSAPGPSLAETPKL